MRNFVKYFIILFTALSIFSSCEEQDRTYTGPLLAEFRDVQFNFIQEEAGNLELKIQLIGAHQSKDITVGYELVEEIIVLGDTMSIGFVQQGTGNSITDTIPIESGVHLNLPQTGTITIPAGSSFGYLQVAIPEAFPMQNIPTQMIFNRLYLGIRLVATDDIGVSENFKDAMLLYKRSKQ